MKWTEGILPGMQAYAGVLESMTGHGPQGEFLAMSDI